MKPLDAPYAASASTIKAGVWIVTYRYFIKAQIKFDLIAQCPKSPHAKARAEQIAALLNQAHAAKVAS